MLEDNGSSSGIHQRLLTTRFARVLEGGCSCFGPDERRVGPTRRTVALGTINGQVFAMGRLC